MTNAEHPIVKALEFDWRQPGAGGIWNGLAGQCRMVEEALVYRCSYYANSAEVANEQRLRVDLFTRHSARRGVISGVRLTGWYENGCRFHFELAGLSMQIALDRLLAAWQRSPKVFRVDAMVDVIIDDALPFLTASHPPGHGASLHIEEWMIRH